MFEINDVNELYALQKGLMEIRFRALDVDWAVKGSPFLSGLHQRVVEAIIAHHECRGEAGKAQGWHDWRRFETRAYERPLIRAYLTEVWDKASSMDAKREIVAGQMRPFAFTADDVTAMVAEIEAEVDSESPD